MRQRCHRLSLPFSTLVSLWLGLRTVYGSDCSVSLPRLDGIEGVSLGRDSRRMNLALKFHMRDKISQQLSAGNRTMCKIAFLPGCSSIVHLSVAVKLAGRMGTQKKTAPTNRDGFSNLMRALSLSPLNRRLTLCVSPSTLCSWLVLLCLCGMRPC